MNIDDYIRATKRNIYALNPRYLEDEEILGLLSQLASDIDPSLIIKPIFSTNIFPEMVHLEKSTYLLWDMHFWDIYKIMLTTNFLLYENDLTENPKSVSSSEILNFATERYRIIFLDVLTSKLRRHPKVAYRLAQEQFFYRKLANKNSNQFEYSFSEQRSLEITSIILLAKLFVFFHEIHHDYLKIDEQYRLDVIELQQEVANIIMEKIDFSKTSASSRTIEALKRRAYKDSATLEESTCDFCAFKLAYKYISMIMPDLDHQKTLEWLYTALATCIGFVEVMNYLEIFWDTTMNQFQNYYLGSDLKLDDIYNQINSYEAKMQNRVSFLSFAIYANLSHTGVDISQSIFRKGEKIVRYITQFTQTFLDFEFLATINHDAQNLKTKNSSPNYFHEAINLLLGNPYE